MKKSSYVLGINLGHNSSATLVKDGELIASIQEERFTRRKNQIGFPKNSISWLLKFAKIKDIDLAVIGTEDPQALSKLYFRGKFSDKEEQKAQDMRKYDSIFNLSLTKYLRREIFESLYYKNPSLALKIISFLHHPKKSENTIYQTIRKELNLPEEKVIFLDHHLTHAYSCISNLDTNLEWLIITLDGEGDKLCGTVNTFKNGVLTRISQTPQKNSLGLLYGYVTYYLGMKKDEHEYKVMGLAPYAKSTYYNNLVITFRKYLFVNTDKLVIESQLDMHNILPFLRRDFFGKRFDNIAGALQQFTEEIILNLVKASIKKTGIKNVAFSGGVAMNVKANQKIVREVNNFYVVPSASDESLSWGAAFWGAKSFGINIDPVKDLYLGCEYTEQQINQVFKKANKKIKIQKKKNIEKTVASLLAKGEVVAWFQGRAEWGARALGHRSILGHPGLPTTLPLINSQIKNRDFWMPFTPSILEEDLGRYIINPKGNQTDYMMITFDTTQLGKHHLVSAIHPADKTTRPQVVRKSWDPKYYNLILEFKRITGIGAVLNTSFNLHGEPMVLSPEDAKHTLLNSGLKYLAIGNFLITKK